MTPEMLNLLRALAPVRDFLEAVAEVDEWARFRNREMISTPDLNAYELRMMREAFQALEIAEHIEPIRAAAAPREG